MKTRKSTLTTLIISISIIQFMVLVQFAGSVYAIEGCTGGFFSAKAPIPAGSGARSVAFADFNRDGRQDAITPSFAGGGQVRVFLGDGADGYALPTSTAVGALPFIVVTADFNRDGKPDFAVSHQTGGIVPAALVSVGYGNGDGTFQAPVTLVTSSYYAEGLAVGDINRDGWTDLAVAVRGTGSPNVVKIYYGTGSGFSIPLDVDLGTDPVSVALADLDLDGRLDLLVGRENPTPGEGNITISYNNGVGFGAAVSVPVGDYPIAIAVGDLNGDKLPDIATANFYSDSATVLLANTGGDLGTYSRTDLEQDTSVSSIAIGDINQDGKGDLAIGVAGNVVVILGAGAAGVFNEDSILAVGGSADGVGLTDFNLDGKPDLIVTNFSEVRILENVCPLYPGGVTGFETSSELAYPFPLDLVSLSYTNTCDPSLKAGLQLDPSCVTFDQTVAVISSDSVSLLEPTGTSTLSVSDPTGVAPVQSGVSPIDTSPSPSPTPVLDTSTTYVVSSGSARRLWLAERTSDPKTDTGGSNNLEEELKDLSLSYFRKTTEGEYLEMVYKVIESDIQSEDTGKLAYGDADKNGETDFFLASKDSDKVHIETVKDPESDTPLIVKIREVLVGDKPIDIITADFNKDGYDDFATANAGDNTASVCLNTALATNCSTISLGAVPTSLASDDMNFDGNADLIVGTQNGIELFYGAGNGTFGTSIPVATADAKVLDVKVADMNVDGKKDIVALTEDPILETKAIETNFTKLETLGSTDYESKIGEKFAVATETKAVLLTKITEDKQTDLMLAKTSLNKIEIVAGVNNIAPVGVGDSFDVAYGAMLESDAPGVLANDSDPEGSAITAVLVSGPASSAGFVLNADGSFTYQSGGAYSPTDSFVYKVFDGAVESGGVTVTLNITDSTPPVLSPIITGVLGSNGWYVGDVAVDWFPADAESGISDQTGCQSETLSVDTAGTTYLCEATNGAGLTTSGSVTVKRDTVAPTLTPVVSPNPVFLNGVAAATPNASDGLSGLFSQSCNTPDTSSVGAGTVGCTATDNAGNVANANGAYNVIFNWGGFFQPVDNLPVLNEVKAGQIVPLRFSLAGYQGMSVISPGFPAASTVGCDAAAPMSVLEETSSPGGSALSYDIETGTYQYNWRTSKASKGTCQILTVHLVDGTAHYAKFRIK